MMRSSGLLVVLLLVGLAGVTDAKAVAVSPRENLVNPS